MEYGEIHAQLSADVNICENHLDFTAAGGMKERSWPWSHKAHVNRKLSGICQYRVTDAACLCHETGIVKYIDTVINASFMLLHYVTLSLSQFVIGRYLPVLFFG